MLGTAANAGRLTNGADNATPVAPSITARRDIEGTNEDIWFPHIGQNKMAKNNGRTIRQISCLEKGHYPLRTAMASISTTRSGWESRRTSTVGLAGRPTPR